MTSFQITVTPNRRVAARFVNDVRRTIQRKLVERAAESGLRQSHIARALGVHRSVINKELRGTKDMTLGRVAEFAWALGLEPRFDLVEPAVAAGANAPGPAVVDTQGRPASSGGIVAKVHEFPRAA